MSIEDWVNVMSLRVRTDPQNNTVLYALTSAFRRVCIDSAAASFESGRWSTAPQMWRGHTSSGTAVTNNLALGLWKSGPSVNNVLVMSNFKHFYTWHCGEVKFFRESYFRAVDLLAFDVGIGDKFRFLGLDFFRKFPIVNNRLFGISSSKDECF